MQAIVIPPALIPLIRAACAALQNVPLPLPPLWATILGAAIHLLCGLVPAAEAEHATGNLTPSITVPSWFWHIIGWACKNVVPTLPPGPYLDLLTELCSLVPQPVAQQHS